jgi:hypothetical protein
MNEYIYLKMQKRSTLVYIYIFFFVIWSLLAMITPTMVLSWEVFFTLLNISYGCLIAFCITYFGIKFWS